MTEFFHSCTTNERKREIGKFGLLKPTLPLNIRNRYFQVCFSTKLVCKGNNVGLVCSTMSREKNVKGQFNITLT